MNHSVNTGLSTGSFHSLRVLKDGLMQDVLGIITAAVAITTINAGSGIQITGTGTSRTIAATGGSTGTILQLGGATQAATTLNFGGAVGTLVGNVLSITAQPAITSTMDLAMQDVTLRNIQAQTAIMLLRDNAGATALEIQASLIGLYKSVNMHETVNF